MADVNSNEVVDQRPTWFVARGVPVVHRGKSYLNFPVQEHAFYDRAEARASLDAWRKIYPDVKLVREEWEE